MVHAEVKRYEKERESNKSTYWLIFELIWRDFFRLFCLKHGNGTRIGSNSCCTSIRTSKPSLVGEGWSPSLRTCVRALVCSRAAGRKACHEHTLIKTLITTITAKLSKTLVKTLIKTNAHLH